MVSATSKLAALPAVGLTFLSYLLTSEHQSWASA